jgi:hypothetical protein
LDGRRGIVFYRQLILPTDFDDALIDELSNFIITGAQA